jgi:methyl-accepting chemotaxis protein
MSIEIPRSLRLGLRGRLFAAFGAVALMTVLASGNALVTYEGLGRSLGVVTDTALRQVTRTAKVAKNAAEVVAAGQALLAAGSADREQALRALNAERDDLLDAMNTLDAEDAARLKDTVARMSDNLDRLARSVAERQSIIAARDAMVGTVRSSHQKLAAKLIPLADDLGFTLAMGIETAADNRDLPEIRQALGALSDKELVALQAVLDMRGESNLMLGILVEAADLPSKDLIPPVKERFVAAAGHLTKAAAAMKNPEIANLVSALVNVGSRDGNIFAVKEKEFAGAAAAAQLVGENKALAGELEKEIAALTTRSEAGATAAVRSSEHEIARGRFILITLAIVSLAIACVLGWFYVGRGVVRRLSGLQHSMARIAAGDLDAEIKNGGADEIADMAAALKVLREGRRAALRSDESAAAERARMADERRQELLTLAKGLESEVKSVVESVTTSAKTMHSTANLMVEVASAASEGAASAASASRQAAGGVQSVASAAEELSTSVGEIGRQVNESAAVASAAVKDAESTRVTVRELADAAARIGDVVKMIQEIAAQTNLLALNATIEAARAGEAGKGFAVVASEVKQLASQTAKATEEISGQIGAIQGATHDAVQAIEHIGATIAKINEIAGAIASAVEQQGATTHDIAHNVHQVAHSTSLVSERVGELANAAGETGQSAQMVRDHASELAHQADGLRAQVDNFLSRIRAA